MTRHSALAASLLLALACAVFHPAARALAQEAPARLQVPVGNATDAAAPPSSPEEAAVVWAGQVSFFIKQEWRVPAAALPEDNRTLVTRVRLQFDANGTLTGHALTRSSNSFAFDDAALKAVALGSSRHPFGPPPTKAPFTFSIDFNSKEQPR
ncbi:TonB C-terminal domain-containing protein [Megalodesulfovibrio paquesii]